MFAKKRKRRKNTATGLRPIVIDLLLMKKGRREALVSRIREMYSYLAHLKPSYRVMRVRNVVIRAWWNAYPGRAYDDAKVELFANLILREMVRDRFSGEFERSSQEVRFSILTLPLITKHSSDYKGRWASGLFKAFKRLPRVSQVATLRALHNRGGDSELLAVLLEKMGYRHLKGDYEAVHSTVEELIVRKKSGSRK